jgi:2,4-dienoyl-CoA reductase-like NADH-dependent reductase (Old Yellow Enzyme family)
MTTPRLFTPWDLGALRLANRIVIAPMCQYSAHDGSATDWHLIHLGQLALSGAGLLILEATAVEAAGRITPGCLGLYSDANEAALARVLEAVRANAPPMPLAIQLAHAGRKASSQVPWRGGAQIPAGEPGAWPAVAPSALAHREGEEAPAALDAGLARLRSAFADAARRASRLGLAGIEIHAAHGYLLHQFLSPLANQRSDAYGGSLDNRMRFPLEVFDAVREAFAPERPVWVRVSATDSVAGSGWDVDDAATFARALAQRGCAAIHVSSGGVSPLQKIKPAPGYQVAMAQRIRQLAGVPTIAVGLITEPEQAEAIVAGCQADAVALARAMLYDPRWPWHAAARLGARVQAPPQYWRSQPREYPDLFAGLVFGAR